MHLHTNRLIHETSPYLLQHAHNPVNWYPWSEEALQIAKDENKPILVSIGYSACHWCHVMERESFENEETAAVMNNGFINIKIDREERPDLDHIYMDAVQAMTGSGGWPLNVFLTPEGKPFYGGTYFPPKPAFNRGSWVDTLTGVLEAFANRRHEIDAQAENLTDHLVQSNSFGQTTEKEGGWMRDQQHEMVKVMMRSADRDWGGFGNAPKFPQTPTILYLLRYYATQYPLQTGPMDLLSLPVDEAGTALQQALLSIDKMIEGGIYDQVGGGFARYATDREWLAPHFEKMLYDNALLVSTISEAYALTRKERYREVIAETIAFVQREMMHAGKGFYAALDADSEGVEGKFYVWELEEIHALLKEDAAVFAAYYDISEKGNWEEKNILRVLKPIEKFAADQHIPVEKLQQLLERGRMVLLQARTTRVRPGLDDKLILGWNALMNTALSKAFAATGEEAYRQLAIENMRFILDHFTNDGGRSFHHCWKDGQARFPAFLDDYAYLIQALLRLQEITADEQWLVKAGELTKYVEEQFSEEDTGFFFYTPVGQQDVIIRKKEVYDGAVPSGNSVMAYNLYQLGILFDATTWRERAAKMVGALGRAIVKHPTSFGIWAGLLQEQIVGTDELAIVGKSYDLLYREVLGLYLPHRVMMGTASGSTMPLLAGKTVGVDSTIHLCRNYTCQRPVNSVEQLVTLANSGKAGN